MTTWTEAADQATDFEFPADLDNRYINLAYVQNGYIGTEGAWSREDSSSTSWA